MLMIEIGPVPFVSTADVYSKSTMSAEMHVGFHMLPCADELNFIAFPIELSPITGHEGQTKKLQDSADRHINALFEIFGCGDGGDGDDVQESANSVHCICCAVLCGAQTFGGYIC